MKRTQTLFAVFLLLVCMTGMSFAHEKITASFIKAFKNGDVVGMSKHFAEEVSFIGDPKFIGRQAGLDGPVVLSKKDLVESYTKLFKLVGHESWLKHTAKAQPTVVVSKDGSELKWGVKKGDVICDMHFREANKGKRNGLDEAVIFVFRKTGDTYKVTFHLADY